MPMMLMTAWPASVLARLKMQRDWRLGALLKRSKKRNLNFLWEKRLDELQPHLRNSKDACFILVLQEDQKLSIQVRMECEFTWQAAGIKL